MPLAVWREFLKFWVGNVFGAKVCKRISIPVSFKGNL